MFDGNLDRTEVIDLACEICNAFSRISDEISNKALDTLDPKNQKFFKQLSSIYLLIALGYVYKINLLGAENGKLKLLWV